jgi:hypothetical protein
MEPHTIERMLDYYFTKPSLREDVWRALKEFFHKPHLAPGDRLEIEEKDEGVFNEWFVFDFKLSNGKTLLEDFYERNPYNLKMARLQVYKDLQENYFGFYKVKEVRLGEGLTLENLQTAKVYEVREFTATFCLKEEQIFSARVGRVGDHYELVGSNPLFGPVRMNSNFENFLRKEKKKLNPKVLRDFFSKNKEPQSSLPDYSSLEEAQAHFKKVLAKYHLDKFINVETIKELIYCSPAKEFPNTCWNMLLCLLDPQREDYNDALNELLTRFTAFYNLCPQKALGDKSPLEKAKDNEEKGIPADIIMSFHRWSIFSWRKKYKKALQYMENRKFKNALKKFNEVFAHFLKHKITYPEIYRLYANKGICHFALGEWELGELMLKIAIELNPFYKFAREQLKRYKKENFANQIKTRKEQEVSGDIGYQYYQFLKPFKINFAHRPQKPPKSVEI